MRRNATRPASTPSSARPGRTGLRWLAALALAASTTAGAQQFTPPGPGTLDEAARPADRLVVALPEAVVFDGIDLDPAARAGIIENIRSADARALTVVPVGPGLVAHQVPDGNVVLPLDMATLAQQTGPIPGVLPGDPCALPEGVSEDQLGALGRLLRQYLVQSSGDSAAFDTHTPQGCPFRRLQYYTRSALVIAPSS